MPSKIFINAIEELPSFRDLREAVKSKTTPVSVSGVSNIHKAQFALGLFEGAPLLLITDDESSAKRLCADINGLALTRNDDVESKASSLSPKAILYPAKDINFTKVFSASREYEHMRIEVLSRLASAGGVIVCASIEAVLQRTLQAEYLKAHIIKISSNSGLNITELTRQLVSAGYERYAQVEGAGQFSVRGAIIDIFPVASESPVRIELWGDEIESITYFDVETQRRTEQTEHLSIPPAIEEMQTPASILDYFDNNRSTVIFCEYRNCAERAKGILAQYREDLKILLERGEYTKEMEGYMVGFAAFESEAERFTVVHFDTFLRSGGHFKKIISVNANQTAPWGGEIRHLIEDLQSFIGHGYSVIVMAGSEKTLPILADDLREEGIPCAVMTENSKLTQGLVLLTSGYVSAGYDYIEAKTALITQTKLQAAKRKLKKAKKGERISSLSDITAGDLVVHVLHGIGRFEGIKKIELEGITKDYITIRYAGTDVLYVPVNQLDLVSKYIGPRDEGGVKLNKLSSMEWQKAKNRVKKAVKDMADELIKLYSARSKIKGFAFSEDCDWQNDFELRFPYAETDDQLKSTREIKDDMQKPVPMDRLLCGDVGFGKTEVAFRAAFKCMLDDKQCVILAPTTVLAWQHYQTALNRFEKFPFKVEMLSRFRSKKEQTEILKQVKNGGVDLIIGTHRLVQKDVEFKDLGLAVIDEEQRFGVAHKERFKEMFNGIDVLTLSATPIPRTLNMAMSGIRDMSVIEEPPVDRHPVQTYVIEYNQAVLEQAVTKELRRGGQVYYIHNRVETIDLCAAKLAQALPEARIGVAHGQITEERLSEIWRRLVEHEIDILVCTTIIETGVDVANVNTLIIEDSDRLGLSQLYQLRGRVGRSPRRAFAYFTFRRGKVLTEIASKRLDAIREFTQFGSGFRIALRDLEIRGAGSILGGKQHGHMESVGYDMYLRLMSEAIAEEKGEPLPRRPEDCLIDLRLEAHIPEDYIENLSLRLDIYRKIASLESKEESIDLLNEINDRFGEPPPSIQGLMTVALLRNMAGSLGVTEIKEKDAIMLFYIKTATIEQVQAVVQSFKGRVTVNGSDKPFIAVKMLQGDNSIELMQNVLEKLNQANNS
ncbi:MAG: transcription-repair coupling factor [Oscillospiraceae bacterium]|nr:transcription-repair coupling factor [Oscillospiraceae bacterium]